LHSETAKYICVNSSTNKIRGFNSTENQSKSIFSHLCIFDS
jgi:hypothetical protein